VSVRVLLPRAVISMLVCRVPAAWVQVNLHHQGHGHVLEGVGGLQHDGGAVQGGQPGDRLPPSPRGPKGALTADTGGCRQLRLPISSSSLL
jgi:hypothetical protein